MNGSQAGYLAKYDLWWLRSWRRGTAVNCLQYNSYTLTYLTNCIQVSTHVFDSSTQLIPQICTGLMHCNIIVPMCFSQWNVSEVAANPRLGGWPAHPLSHLNTHLCSKEALYRRVKPLLLCDWDSQDGFSRLFNKNVDKSKNMHHSKKYLQSEWLVCWISPHKAAHREDQPTEKRKHFRSWSNSHTHCAKRTRWLVCLKKCWL